VGLLLAEARFAGMPVIEPSGLIVECVERQHKSNFG
jgi:hypothetical protein